MSRVGKILINWCLCQKLSLSPLYFNKTLLHTHTHKDNVRISGKQYFIALLCFKFWEFVFAFLIEIIHGVIHEWIRGILVSEKWNYMEFLNVWYIHGHTQQTLLWALLVEGEVMQSDKKWLGRDPSGRLIKPSLHWAGSTVSSTISSFALPNTGPDGKNQRATYELILSMIALMTLCKLQLPVSKSS